LAARVPEPAARRPAVLVAEDNLVFQTMLRTLLVKWNYEILLARDGDEAWRTLDGPDPPRLAILDWMMPGVDGVEICRRVRAAAREPYTYILLLTARTEAQDLVDGMDAGADDYLTKPFRAHELRVRLRDGRRILELQEQLLEAREALREQATRDGLTGLFNRVAIFQALHQELKRAARDRSPLAVLMVDVDFFKRINDSWGHSAGDTVLREAARRMQSAVRAYDIVGRYGGEEFLVLLPGCDLAAGSSGAERIREALAAHPFEIPGQSLQVTCSIGVSCRHRPEPAVADALVREADVALYSAKGAGRNRVAAYSYPLG
jgi:diguanylate cyclase (GGDEF)-like protein